LREKEREALPEWTTRLYSSQPGPFREFLLFLGYHAHPKDGRKGTQKKQKVPKYQNTPGMISFGRDGIEDVCLKAKYTLRIKKLS